MKRIKFLALLAFAAFTAVSFNACKGDDDGDDDNKDENVLVEKNGTKYTVKISDLSDNDSELSFTETYNYVEPDEAKVEMKYVFKYAASIALEPADSTTTDSVSTSAPAEVVKDSLPITLWKIITTCDKEEYAQSVYESYKADSTENANAVIEIDDNVVTCTYSGEEDFIYLMVKAIYDRHKESIDKDLDKAKAAAEANKNKENKPEETKPNTSAKNSRLDLTKNADEPWKKDTSSITMLYVNASAGRGVAYNFNLNEDGSFASGTVVVAFKNADEAKAYAKSEGRAKDENGDRIYKSVSVDGGNVVLAYSSKALAEMTEETAKALFNEKKNEIGASTPTTPEENNGENNEEENGENNGEENSENSGDNEGNNENSDNQEDTPQSEE
jgi:hypothetical protein